MINITCDIGIVCTTTGSDSGMSPFERWSGKYGSLKGLPSFGVVEIFETGNRRNKLDPRSIKRVLPRRARNRLVGS